MKKVNKLMSVIALVLVFALALAVTAGCGSDNAANGSGDNGGTTGNGGNGQPAASPGQGSDDIVSGFRDPSGEINLEFVAIVMVQMVHQFFVDVEAELRASLEAEGIRVDTSSYDNDAAQKIAILENYGRMGVDGIILFVNSLGAGPGLDATLNQLVDEGIRIITFITPVDARVHGQVLVDNADVGIVNAQMAAEMLMR